MIYRKHAGRSEYRPRYCSEGITELQQPLDQSINQNRKTGWWWNPGLSLCWLQSHMDCPSCLGENHFQSQVPFTKEMSALWSKAPGTFLRIQLQGLGGFPLGVAWIRQIACWLEWILPLFIFMLFEGGYGFLILWTLLLNKGLCEPLILISA